MVRNLKIALLFFLYFIVTLLLCDLFINFGGIYSVNNTQYTEGIGKTMRPNLQYIYFNEGFAMGKTSAYGYFGKEYPKEKNKAITRIALLGDSFVEGIQLLDRNHFATLIEDKLNDKNKVEVLNFGRSEFGLGNMYAYDKLFVDQFNPDFILYFLNNGNLENDYQDALLPKTLLQNDSLVFNSFTSAFDLKKYKTANRFLKKSALLSMVNNGKRYLNESNFRRILNLPEQNSTKAIISERNIKLSQLSKRILDKLDKNRVILVWCSTELIPNALLKYSDLLDIKLIDLSQPLDSMVKKGSNPRYWKITNKYGHWNHDAHEVIGKHIAKKLLESF